MDTNDKNLETSQESSQQSAGGMAQERQEDASPTLSVGQRRPADGERRRRPAEGERSRPVEGTKPQRTAGSARKRHSGEGKMRQSADSDMEHRREERRRKTSGAARAGQNGNERVRNQAVKSKPQKKKAAKPADAQYQPYRAANRQKKAQRNKNVKKLFSNESPVLNFFRNLGDKGDAFADSSDIALKRKAQREADAARKRKRASMINTPAVVYTEPIAFNRDRLLVQLITVIAVVLAFVLGLSVFFKVKTITISGAEVYSPWSVREASGIKEGDNLLTFGRAKASGQITANLPYVKSVRIGIKLPDTVNIEIQEEDVVYAIKSDQGIWWLINSEGKVMEMANNSVAGSHTQVLGVTLTDPKVNEPGVATEEVPTETTPDGEYIPVTMTGYQRLNAAMQILRALEDNDIVGEAASVDVSRMEDIILWYGTRYQVNLGDAEKLDYKIACMVDVILQMSDYQNGILDVSFTTWEDQVGFTPFQ